MISHRSCAKSSAYYNGSTRYYCGTHHHEMTNEEYQCAIGRALADVIADFNTILATHSSRISQLETHFTTHLKTFAANLEKLHERDP